MSNTFYPTAGVQRVYWSKNFKNDLPFSNASHYENPEVDRLLEATSAEPHLDKRAKYFKDFQVIIARDLPAINLVSPIQPVVGSIRIRDYAAIAKELAAFEVPADDIKVILIEVEPVNWGLRDMPANEIDLGYKIDV